MLKIEFTTTAVVAKAAMLVMLMGLLAACSTTPPTRAQLQLEQMYDEGCDGADYCH